ncbi:MAG: VPLPA-CTERM sorting domain-containing protein [Gammaproteobacteria bacterium]|nr:VPLPA-CTERM sorting domain-containing protein [Gammaproteobacteria bacterium]
MSGISQFFKVCAISGVTLFSTLATSASFTGYAYGEFSNPVSGVNDYINIVNNDLGYYSSNKSNFNWGIDRRGHSSQFRFDGNASDYVESDFTVSEGSAFSLGEFTYVNRATRYSADVSGVDFDLNVNLLGIGWSTFNYSLSIDNTPNGSKNVPDYVSLISQGEDSLFSYLGESYRFEILGFSRDGGLTFEDSTFANERSSTTAEIYGQIQAVPVPAALWLFGSGLLTLGALVKRKNR